jgi:hypothetical protein
MGPKQPRIAEALTTWLFYGCFLALLPILLLAVLAPLIGRSSFDPIFRSRDLLVFSVVSLATVLGKVSECEPDPFTLRRRPDLRAWRRVATRVGLTLLVCSVGVYVVVALRDWYIIGSVNETVLAWLNGAFAVAAMLYGGGWAGLAHRGGPA